MRHAVLALAAVLLLAAGCESPVGIEIVNSFSLNVRVMDASTGGPYTVHAAQVVVEQTGDALYTDDQGWARALKVPREAEYVNVKIRWIDNCADPHTDTHQVLLRHGTTDFTAWVNSRCWR